MIVPQLSGEQVRGIHSHVFGLTALLQAYPDVQLHNDCCPQLSLIDISITKSRSASYVTNPQIESDGHMPQVTVGHSSVRKLLATKECMPVSLISTTLEKGPLEQLACWHPPAKKASASTTAAASL